VCESRKPLLILTGPTAVGKTRLSIRLAKELNGSIISADSMQIYKKMNIGSAKIMPEEMEGIPHYLIDVLDPKDEFNVVRFQTMAKEAMDEILKSGRLPILTGGTGFYIQALLRDIDFSESTGRSAYRNELEAKAGREGRQAVHDMLRTVDLKAAESIPPGNLKRVIRALEFYRETGKKISEHNQEQHQKSSPYQSAYFVLTDEREKLYRRIDRRVDQMVGAGLFQEVEQLRKAGLTEDHISMKGIGYRELFPYFAGSITREEAICQIKTDTRHFAKRQLTWFRREPDVVWINRSAFDQDENRMLAYILEKWREIKDE
jgi:tRNA dimethylallyltransferase